MGSVMSKPVYISSGHVLEVLLSCPMLFCVPPAVPSAASRPMFLVASADLPSPLHMLSVVAGLLRGASVKFSLSQPRFFLTEFLLVPF